MKILVKDVLVFHSKTRHLDDLIDWLEEQKTLIFEKHNTTDIRYCGDWLLGDPAIEFFRIETDEEYQIRLGVLDKIQKDNEEFQEYLRLKEKFTK